MCLTEDIDGQLSLFSSLKIIVYIFSNRNWDIEFADRPIGLFRKAHHPRDQLLELYGSLMDIKCSDSADTGCTHIEGNNIEEPVCLCPALATSGTELESFSYEQPTVQPKIKSRSCRRSNISETKEQAHNEKRRKCDMQTIPLHDLPHCPECFMSLLRPGLNWPGEEALQTHINKAKYWMDCQIRLDLMLIIGTPANKLPALEFVQKAMDLGASIAWVGVKREEMTCWSVRKDKDLLFPGDVGEGLEDLFVKELRTDIV
jgi:NAD-dependent deacetylase sirtuin 5